MLTHTSPDRAPRIGDQQAWSKRAVTYMVNQSGGKWVEPISRISPPAPRTGKEVLKA